MIREWMAYALVVGALVAVAGLCLEALCRATGRPTRWVWALALGSTLALVALAPLRRADRGVALSVPVRVVNVSATATRDGGVAQLLARARTLVVRPLDDALLLAARLPRAADRWIVVVWVVAGALLLFTLTTAWLRWRRASRRWPAADVQGVRVRVAPDTGPAAVGILAPEIVVPRWLLAVAPEQQRLAVAHEQEHLRVRDPLLLTAGLVAAVLLPWHPAVWWMLARLRLCVELDCDARVLRRGRADAAGYGSVLIDLAERCSATRLGAPALADGSTHLHRRILAMTSRPSRFAPLRAGIFAVVALAGMVAACEAHLPTSAEVERMDARGAERQVATRAVFDSVTSYEVDGVAVTREKAMSIPSSDIAAIVVRRRVTPTGCVRNGDGSETCTTSSRVLPGSQLSIRTRENVETTHQDITVPRSEPRAPFMVQVDKRSGKPRVEARDGMNRGEFKGLIFIDGVRSEKSALSALSPKDIASIEVLKGAAAAQAYGPAATNGVILVSTIHAKRQ